MGVLEEKDCIYCGAKNSLRICLTTGMISCGECNEISRFINEREYKRLEKKLKVFEKKRNKIQNKAGKRYLKKVRKMANNPVPKKGPSLRIPRSPK